MTEEPKTLKQRSCEDSTSTTEATTTESRMSPDGAGRRGRKPKYSTDEERKEARRVRQRNYYNRIKDERRELLNLQALRRYYKKKIRSSDSDDSEKNDAEKLTVKLSEIEAKIQAKINTEEPNAIDRTGEALKQRSCEDSAV